MREEAGKEKRTSLSAAATEGGASLKGGFANFIGTTALELALKGGKEYKALLQKP